MDIVNTDLVWEILNIAIYVVMSSFGFSIILDLTLYGIFKAIKLFKL